MQLAKKGEISKREMVRQSSSRKKGPIRMKRQIMPRNVRGSDLYYLLIN